MADDLGTALRSAAQTWRAEFQREMAARGFAAHAGAAGDVLMHLTPSGASQSALPAQMGLSKQAVQQLLDQLEAGQYIQREADPADRRAKRIVLTPFGQREFAERGKVIALLEERSRERVGKKLMGKLEKALKRLAHP